MTTCPHCGLVHGAKNHFCPVTGHPVELGPRLISESLLDRFRAITVMSQGSVGIVLEVEDQKDHQRYAAKVIHPQFTRNCIQAESYFSDVRAIQTINSPYVARVLAAGKDSGATFTVIREHLEGRTLRQRLNDEKKLPTTDAVRLARQILIAIEDLQTAGVSVVDFSMGDVFLVPTDTGETVKLLDLGEYHFKLFIPADIADLGSRRYRAPELQPGANMRHVGEGAGVYAVGAMLYEMLTGTFPASPPAPLDSFVPGLLSAKLAAIIQKSVAVAPLDRFVSPRVFREQLENQIREVRAKDSPVADAAAGPAVAPVEAVDGDSQGHEDGPRGPSVIVDMPEIEGKVVGRSKAPWIAGLTLLVLAALGGLGVWGFGSGIHRITDPDIPEKVEIRVETIPPKAAVSFDGKRVDGHPAVIKMLPDGRLHTISAKAEGFESLEKDVKLEEAQTVTLELVEIIEPDSSGKDKAAQIDPAVEMAPKAKKTARGNARPAKKRIRDKTNDVARDDAKSTMRASKKRAAHKSKKVASQKKNKHRKRKRPAKTRDGFSRVNPFD